MSRSNPHNNNNPNPCQYWWEWAGKEGVLRRYDKDKKENIFSPPPFTFLLLDQLACVKGWHDASNSGIYSNEVRDTRSEPMTVKTFGGPVLADGLYSEIKHVIQSKGAKFVANLYIAFKEQGELVLGSLQLKGAALRAWSDFVKENKSSIYTKAIIITGSREGKKGSVTFKLPEFDLRDTNSTTDEAAKKLDADLQAYLSGYLSRSHGGNSPSAVRPPSKPDHYDTEPEEDDIPF